MNFGFSLSHKTVPSQPRAGRWHTCSRLTLRSAVLLLILSLGSRIAYAQGYTEQTLYNFTATDGRGDNSDGAAPCGTLIEIGGLLYGTTNQGGTTESGVIFSLNPSTHTQKTLCTFGSGTIDGTQPLDGLIAVGNLLYGTTTAEGIGGFGTHNQGTVFSFTPSSSTEKKLCTFTGDGSNGDAAAPETSLINLNGTLYGTTEKGGTHNGGTVFEVTTDGSSEQVLYNFGTNTDDGAFPRCSLILLHGVLYGTTSGGGNSTNGGSSYGTLFSIDPASGTEHVLYRFSFPDANGDNKDGSNPLAGLTEVGGILYGITSHGGSDDDGTVFAFNPSTDVLTTLHSFTKSISSGELPQASLTNVNGILYGITEQGGTNNSGMVFSINPNGTGYQTIYNFGSTTDDGANPVGGLLDVNGTLYGTTTAGGTSNTGIVFALTPNFAPPVARNDSYLPKYATAYAVKAPGVLGNDANSVSATLVTNASHGTLTFHSDGSFVYTPAAGFAGTDSFTYQANNAAGSSTATVSLVVQTSVPTAHNDTYAPTYSHAYKVNAPGVLGNDYAGDTGSLTAKLVSTVSHGTLTLNSDGSFLYSPTFEYSGTDSFTYTATNAIGTSNTATVTFTINPVVPIAHNDVYAPKYATAYGVSAPGVLGNDDDGGTAPMTAALVANVTHGTLTFNSNGSFTYTPAAGFVGADSFTYQDTTPTGTGNTATVTLNVTATVPIAHNDSYAVGHNKAFAVKAPGVLGNDYAGDSGSFTASLVSSVTHGTLSFKSDGSFNYTPSTGFTGTDTFTYQAKNAIGTSNTATVTLTVQ